jgi:hypothetical protein
MREIVFLIVLVGLCTGVAIADPDPPCISTSLDASGRLLLIPDNDGTNPSMFGNFTVTVKNGSCVPINHAIVEIVLTGPERVQTCGSAVMAKYTDPAGVVEFNIPGGGCHKGESAVRIRANGITVRDFMNVVSPDYAGWDNAGQAGKMSLSITAVDFAAFAQAVANGGSSCHDYDNNGTTGASDVSVFGQVWAGGTRRCSP